MCSEVGGSAQPPTLYQGLSGQVFSSLIIVVYRLPIMPHFSLSVKPWPKMCYNKPMKNKVWKMVRSSLKGSWGWFTLSMFLSVIMVGSNIVQPVIYGRLIDQITNAVSQSQTIQTALTTVTPLLALWALFFITGLVVGSLAGLVTWYATLSVMKKFADFLYRTIIRLGVRWHHDHKSGDLIRRFSKAWDGLWMIQDGILSTLFPSLLSFFAVLVIGF